MVPIVVLLLFSPAAAGGRGEVWSGRGCTASGCHRGIEPIRQPDSGMFKRIAERGARHGDPDGCIVCHGGTPAASSAEAAHAGSTAALTVEGGPNAFFPDPASPWVNQRSCGQCHAELVRAQWNSLMMTEAGKIQGTTWAFGSLESYDHSWANYDGRNPESASARLGTEAYRAYMAKKHDAHPNVYVATQKTLPAAPAAGGLDRLVEHPEEAAFTYIRGECQRCHLGVKGRSRRGDYRGMGCGACHVPYGNEGLYEGGDRTIARDEPGHLLVHTIQATRDAVVAVGGTRYSGVPVETCTTCHNRGKRIGVSYQGLMESAYGSPYTEGGGGQIALHTKHYIFLAEDVHYTKGMLCQDCHTSADVHGDGFIAATNLAAVEIECSDCHGTPDRFPWELPLGWGDENAAGVAEGPPRGVARELPEYLAKGFVAARSDGWILTARGNPMPEVVRIGDRVVVHTAGGEDLSLDPLKRKTELGELSMEARTAMVNVGKHIDTMECYACHSTWAPQCYGCHVKVDYSKEQKSLDWVAAGHAHARPDGRTARGEQGFAVEIPGRVTETRSYMRWEDPPLGNNGEGRVSPLIPGCQVSVTVIGQDGRDIVRNRIFRTEPYSEGSDERGQLSTDMSPVHPHTVGNARPCESCHGSAKALGYGIGGGINKPWDQAKVIDLMTADGTVIPKSSRVQIEPVEGLGFDWSALVTPQGDQLQTVGHHFTGSGPLTDEQRLRMDRHDICLGCHGEIPKGSLAVSLLHHAADMAGQLPYSHAQHESLLRKILGIAAWVQIGGLGLVLMSAVAVAWWWRRRLRHRSSHSH